MVGSIAPFPLITYHFEGAVEGWEVFPWHAGIPWGFIPSTIRKKEKKPKIIVDYLPQTTQILPVDPLVYTGKERFSPETAVMAIL